MRDQHGYGRDECEVSDDRAYGLAEAPRPTGKGRASAVDDALARLSEAIDSQTKAIDQLASLLEPVLGPQLAEAAEGRAEDEPTVSPLAQQITHMAQMLEYRTAALREMTGRVEL
jgi:uncharacterized coiled-coil protein SlyX